MKFFRLLCTVDPPGVKERVENFQNHCFSVDACLLIAQAQVATASGVTKFGKVQAADPRRNYEESIYF